jgi:hypothetical protein
VAGGGKGMGDACAHQASAHHVDSFFGIHAVSSFIGL